MGRGESEQKVQKLPANLIKNGDQYYKVAENKDAYVYKKLLSKNHFGYEVFKKKIKPGIYDTYGNLLPAQEWFPEYFP